MSLVSACGVPPPVPSGPAPGGDAVFRLDPGHGADVAVSSPSSPIAGARLVVPRTSMPAVARGEVLYAVLGRPPGAPALPDDQAMAGVAIEFALMIMPGWRVVQPAGPVTVTVPYHAARAAGAQSALALRHGAEGTWRDVAGAVWTVDPPRISGRTPALSPFVAVLDFGLVRPVFDAVELVTQEDTTLVGQLEAEDPNGDRLAFALAEAPRAGMATVEAGGAFHYRPSPDWSGDDAFAVSVSDGAFGAVAAVGVRVLPENDPPRALDDRYAVDEDQTLTVAAPGVLLNDEDLETIGLRAGLVTAPAMGTLRLDVGGGFTYRPHADAYGVDRFTYRADDLGGVASRLATVILDVAALNDAPLAVDDLVGTREDVVVIVPVLANDGDVDGDPVTVVGHGQGAAGAVTAAGGNLVYTPAAHAFGSDAFDYWISDGGRTANGIVYVTVDPVNDAPVLVTGTTHLAFRGQAAAPDSAVVEGVPAPGADVTWELWLRRDDAGGRQAALAVSDGAAPEAAPVMWLGLEDGQPECGVVTALGSTLVARAGSARALEPGVWTHVACRFAAGRDLDLFVAGQGAAAATAAAAGSVAPGAPRLSLGHHEGAAPGAEEPLRADLAEVRVWTVARDDGQIAAHHAGRLADPAALRAGGGLVGYWPLDDGCGTRPRDAGGGARPARLGGGVAAPTWGASRATRATEPLSLADIAIDDVDSTTLALELQVEEGTLALAEGVPGGVAVGDVVGNGTANLRVVAPRAALAETLAAAGGLVYQPTEQAAARRVNLGLTLDDRVEAGDDAGLTVQAVIPLRITAAPAILDEAYASRLAQSCGCR